MIIVLEYSIKDFVERTPCARDSFLYGIFGSMFAGAGTFVYTSKTVV